MPDALKQPRTIFGLSAILAIAIAAVYIAMFAAPPKPAIAQGGGGGGGEPAALTPLECEALLIHAGLDPDRLACAGVTSVAAAVVATAAIASVEENLAELRSGFSGVSGYRQEVEDLQNAIVSGQGDEGSVQALATAKANLAAAESALSTTLDTVFDAATVSLSNEKAVLASLRADPVVNLPNPYRLANYDEAGAVVLRDALHQERIAAEDEQELDQANAGVIDDAQNISAVNTALANQATLKGGVTTAWDNAMAGVGGE